MKNMGVLSGFEIQGNICKAIDIVRSKRKTLALEVSDTARVVVRAPFRVSEATIADFLSTHSQWVARKVVQAQTRLSYRIPRVYVAGDHVSYLGASFPMTTATQRSVTFRSSFVIPDVAEIQKKTLLKKWYRTQARTLFQERLRLYAKQMDVTPSTLRVTNAQSRWGSCSSKGSINLSWRLVLAPVSVIDYVVVHELAHLAHMNHSKRFWNMVAKYCANYKTSQEWLSRYGSALQI